MTNHIKEMMESGVEEGVFPGGVLLAAKENEICFLESAGTLARDLDTPVNSETVFDLASLTKALVTVPALMVLFQEKLITPETRLGGLFGKDVAPALQGLTIENLLVHNSGLPAHKPYYETLMTYPEKDRLSLLKEMVLMSTPEADPGKRTEYSDLGFMILGWVVETITGVGLDTFVKETVYSPFGIDSLYFPATDKRKVVCAATEECPWRKKRLCGEVHDDNAWAAGGVMGHAGLFGTASGVHALLQAILAANNDPGGYSVLSHDVVRYFLTPLKDTGRTPGFDMPSAKGSSSGRFFSELSVGHLGFTGTSFWMDLKTGIIIVLLTNRVNPSRENIRIRKFRPEIHDLVMRVMKNKNS